MFTTTFTNATQQEIQLNQCYAMRNTFPVSCTQQTACQANWEPAGCILYQTLVYTRLHGVVPSTFHIILCAYPEHNLLEWDEAPLF